MSKPEEDDALLFGESDYGEPAESGRPPDDWEPPSWRNREDKSWWWRDDEGKWRPDPCPVRCRGFVDGNFHFITAFGEARVFRSGELHSRAGLPDLFGGEFWWMLRHFRKYDLEKKALVGKIQREKCVAYFIRESGLAKYNDGTKKLRKVGTWQGPNDRPVVHSGDSIFYDGKIYRPGDEIGDIFYVVGGKRAAPSFSPIGDYGRGYRWLPAGGSVGRTVAAHLGEWVWDSAEALDLFLGGLHCDMLCSSLSWLPHKFVVAPQGSGKSSLLEYARALVGASAHDVQKSYTKAWFEQNFASTGCAFYLDEAESDEDGGRIRSLFEMVRLLSDDGAQGGRGSASGQARKIDVHGTVTMAATLTEEWKPQDRSRITLLEIRPFADRTDQPPAPPEQLKSQLKQAAEFSPALRARAVETWDLFQRNLTIARAAILEMGGQPRDADQVGHLIAGWKTMTSDADLGEADQLERFRPFIMSLAEADDADDAPHDLLNTLFSTAPDLWRSGERLTIGQMIAKARTEDPEASQWRRALPPNGLRLEKQAGETWAQAWLWVASKHVGLDRLFTNHPTYRGSKRAQILRQLRRSDGKVTIAATRSQGTARFAGAASRYVLIPPAFLPSEVDG